MTNTIGKPGVALIMFTVGLMLLCWLFSPAWGDDIQRIEIPSSLNPVGSGARALGMGGAFIAMADDATAASWNPAGLFQIKKPRTSLALSGFRRCEDNRFGTNPEGDGAQTVYQGNINYAGFVFPLEHVQPRMALAVTYQYLFDLNRDWTLPLRIESASVSADQSFDFEQKGGLSALGLSYSVQISPRLGAGVTFNIWDAALNPNQWDERTRQIWSGTLNGNRFHLSSEIFNEYTFSGYNINLGLLWEAIGDRLKIGAVFKSPFVADVHHEQRSASVLRFPDEPEADSINTDHISANETLEMPMSLGLGFSLRFRSALVVNLDVYRTEWSDFVLEDAQGNRTSPITGKPVNESNVYATHQVRLGGQYIFRRHGATKYLFDIPLRAGIFYDPAPGQGSSDDYYGFSLGTGLKYQAHRYHIALDIAYQYRFGKDVGTAVFENLRFSQNVEEHTMMLSLIVRHGSRPQ